MAIKSIDQMTPAEMDEEMKRQQLIHMRLQTEQLTESNAQFLAKKAQRERTNRQRQAQLQTDRDGRKKLRNICNHRQGGTPKQPYRGKGPTSLNIVKMPDGFTVHIMCGICHGRWWSPFPPDQSQKPKFIRAENRRETAREVQARVKKYREDKAEFDALMEKAEDGLTPESTTPMDCGVKIKVTDGDGMPVFRPRPSDLYAA